MNLPEFDQSAVIKPTPVRNVDGDAARLVDFSEIPVIDIALAESEDHKDRASVAKALRKAAEHVGFFYIKNHGVDAARIDAAQAAAAEFYALPEDVKRKYDVALTKRHRGYVPVGGLSADPTLSDLQEGYEVGFDLPADDPDHLAGNPLMGPNIWPAEVPAFETAISAYFDDLMRVGRLLYRLFALSVDMPETFFDDKLTKPCAQLRVLYYPDAKPQDDTVGIGAHTDYESFTILWQSQPGLQVQNRAGQWIEAPPIPGTFIVNIADMMMRWTNDRFVSTPHRVMNISGKARYSLALFFATDYDTIVECLPSCQSPDNSAKYPPTHFGHWIENMHTYSYAYRWADRGKLPNPEQGVTPGAGFSKS